MTLLSYFYKTKVTKSSSSDLNKIKVIPEDNSPDGHKASLDRTERDLYATKKSFNEESKGATSRLFIILSYHKSSFYII